jgi:hypothetical protein
VNYGAERITYTFPVAKPSGLNCTVKLVDLTGKELLRRQLGAIQAGTRVELDGLDLPPGFYVLSHNAVELDRKHAVFFMVR